MLPKTIFLSPHLDKNRFKRLISESSWVLVGQFVTFLATLIQVRVLTQYLSPALYGQLALLLTISLLANQLVLGGITNGITRYFSVANDKEELPFYFGASFRLWVYSSILIVLIGSLLLLTTSTSVGSKYTLQIVSVILFSLFTGGNFIVGGILNAARKRQIVAMHSAGDAVLKIVLVLMLVNFLRTSIAGILLCFSISAFVVTVSQFNFLKKNWNIVGITSHRSADKKWIHSILKFAWPFSVWGLFTWAQQASDRWALEHYATTAEVGKYVTVFQLGYAPIVLLTTLVTSFLTPIFYQRYGSGSDVLMKKSVHRLTRLITLFCIIVTISGFLFTFFLHSWIFDFFVAPPFHSASKFLPWMVVAGGLFATGQFLSLKLMTEFRPNVMIASKIVPATLGIVMNVWAASQFGIAGVVGSLVAFGFVYFVWTYWLANERSVS